MKKNVIPIFLFFLFSIHKGYSQNLYLGINGGILNNNVIVENYNSNRPSWNKEKMNSINWGINLGYKLSNRWKIETQLQLINLGYKEKLDLLYHFQDGPIAGTMVKTVDWTTNHYYMRIPLLAQYNFLSEQSKFEFAIFAGLNFGLLLNQTSKVVGEKVFSLEEQKNAGIIDIPIRKLDFGLQAGIRVKKHLNKSFSIFIDGTIYQGFQSIIDYPKSAPYRTASDYEFYNIVNRHLTANIGILYNFNLSKQN